MKATMKATTTKTTTTTTTKTTKQHMNVKQPPFAYEFGGPFGAAGCMIGLPITIYSLYALCNRTYCVSAWPHEGFQLPVLDECFERVDVLVVIGWIMFQVSLERLLPGPWVKGVQLPNGNRLPYKMNGHLAFWTTMALIAYGRPVFNTTTGRWEGQTHINLSYLYDHFVPLATASMIVSLCLSVFVYLWSHIQHPHPHTQQHQHQHQHTGTLLAKNGQSPSALYNFFIGRELNPRIGTFDLKCFCELRPGLMGWVVLNLGMLMKQYERYQAVSPSMMLVNAFQMLYVWDALYYEQCILTTMDITTDGFGFMLAFGDLSWVPFVYSLQARYLVDYDPDLSQSALLAIVCLQFLGYIVFRGANAEKNAFRTKPESNPAFKSIRTTDGRKLLVSGWWGMARKINYTGDWLMALAWCSLCGTHSIVPYFYAIYFAVLLVHRSLRDDQACADKYGSAWHEYKSRVPYRFIPYVY